MADFHHPQPPLRAAGRHPARLASLLLLAAGLSLMVPLPALQAQSGLLQSVRRDPAKAKAICRQLKEMNKQGVSYTSKRATRTIAAQEGLSLMDAEVLTTYVVGIHCPDVT
ncbi:MAG: hypothetical protein AAFX65_00370 [Cyanobacteria bacterium J06638_7]